MDSEEKLVAVAAAKAAKKASKKHRTKQIRTLAKLHSRSGKEEKLKDERGDSDNLISQEEKTVPMRRIEKKKNVNRSKMKKKQLLRAAQNAGYPLSDGFGKRNCVLSRGDLEGHVLLPKSRVKKMLKHVFPYENAGLQGESYTAIKYRHSAAHASFSNAAMELITIESNQILRRVVNEAALRAVESGKSRISCGHVSAALRPLCDSMDLVANCPPNVFIAKARLDGLLPLDDNVALRTAQETQMNQYENAI